MKYITIAAIKNRKNILDVVDKPAVSPMLEKIPSIPKKTEETIAETTPKK